MSSRVGKGNNKKTKVQQSLGTTILETSTFAYVFWMLLTYPVFFHDGFIDIVRSKLAYYKGVTIFFLVAAVIGLLFYWVDNGVKTPEKPASFAAWLKGVPKEDLFAGVFFAAVILSTLVSDYRSEAFWGTEGRRLGAMVMLLYLFVYRMCAKHLRMQNGKYKAALLWAFIASNAVVILLGDLQFWGIDIFHMYDNLIESQYAMFISTIGNVNVNAGYLCLILPVVMAFYFVSEHKIRKAVYAVFLVAGIYEAYATVSDSWLLGIGAGYLVLFWFACKSHDGMRKFLELCGFFWLANFLMRLSLVIGEAAGADAALYLQFRELGLQNFITSWGMVIATGALLALCFLVFGLLGKKQVAFPYLLLRRVVFIAVAVAAVCVLVVFIVANTRGEGEWQGTFALLNHLQVTDSFGSNRGYVWKRCLTAFWKLPWYQKIFGYGLNCFGQLMAIDYTQEMMTLYNGMYIDAHNEALQFLVTTGIVGAVGYFGILIGAVVKCAKKAADNPLLIAGIAGILGYLAQAMVNNPQTFLTPTVFLFLGVLKCIEKKE